MRTTVFFKGCALRCSWCHNPESQLERPELMFHERLCHSCFRCRSACPADAIIDGPDGRIDRDKCTGCMLCAEICPYGALKVAGGSTSIEAILEEIVRDSVFYRYSKGGVTASGGEPLVQFRAVEELFTRCHDLGLSTALDTCGYASREALWVVEPHTDLFLYDLKGVDATKHREWTGVDDRVTLDNLERLVATRGQDVRIRIPLIPGFNDDPEEVEAMLRFVARLPPVQGVDVLPYHSFAESKYRSLP
jgi:pyruvate formate lyase activating enzyme